MVQVHTFTNSNPYTQVVRDGVTGIPFSGYRVSNTQIGVAETVTVTLAPLPYYTLADLGSLSDPLGGGTWNATTHTFTETGISTGTPTSATQILDRLVYKAPTLPAGQAETVLATVSVNGVTDPNGAMRLETVTPPAISGTVKDEPVAAGSTVRPFATAWVTDTNFGFDTTLTATITLTDQGKTTDADGLLSGNGLSKVGTGVYTLSGTNLYTLTSLVFTPTATNRTRTTDFELKVVDTKVNLSADDKATSVVTIVNPTAPLVAGTWGGQTVAASGTIKPFSAVTISDTNAKPSDAVALTVSGGGNLSGRGLSDEGNGFYTIAAASPQAVTGILNALIFTPPALAPGQTTNTINIRLDVADGGQIATDTKTLINEVAVVRPPPVVASPNDTVVLAGSGGAITDGGGNVWTIDTAKKVVVNGVEDYNTGGVVELAYVNGAVWQENTDKLWWGKTSLSADWSPDAGTLNSPLPPPPPIVIVPPPIVPPPVVMPPILPSGPTVTVTVPVPPRTIAGAGDHAVVTFRGAESEYTIKYTGNRTVTVSDNVAQRDGFVTSINNEVLQFRDQMYFIESGDGANIARLYSAGLGRVPDAPGLANWEAIYSNNVSAAAKAQGVYVSLAETSGNYFHNLSIADGIIDSPEFQAKYGALSNQDFVTQLYHNVLGRAPEAAGLNDWLTRLTTGDATGQVYNRGMVLVGFAESPENIAKAGSWMVDTSKSG